MKTSPLHVAFCLCAGLSAGVLHAAPQLTLQFPAAAVATMQRSEALASFRLPIGPFQNGQIASELTEGNLHQTAWRIDLPDASTLEVTNALRAQITAAGFTVMFECETQACGGYDFRYGSDVLAEPDMHVDLGDFRYIAAQRAGPDGREYLGLMVSKSPENAYVQLTQIGGASVANAPAPAVTQTQTGNFSLKPTVAPDAPKADTDIGKTLDLGASLVLEDLVFGSGSAALSDGSYPSLAALAQWLQANPDKAVTLVGHTDASGGMASNIALSKKRAESVRQSLIAQYGVGAGQVSANGVGPLAPRASNQTPEGQQQNRRVEVVLTSTLQ